MVLAELTAGDVTGIGYTYAHEATANLGRELASHVVVGQDPFDIPGIWGDLVRAERNLGRVGLGAMAVSMLDNALWDLKARLLGLPLARLLGAVRGSVPVYGSGGFISYTREELVNELAGWVNSGIPRVKMKIGLGVAEDISRISQVRTSIGGAPELFVDANEAYGRREALRVAEQLPSLGVTWFEQPIQQEDEGGMRFLRDALPLSVNLATGEYHSDLADFRDTLLAGSADVLQPDVTRCRGITGFLRAAALCEAFNVPVSSHCAPAQHVALGACVPNFLHLEYFVDHARIENLLFDGVREPRGGFLEPDLARPGFGFELREADLERYAA